MCSHYLMVVKATNFVHDPPLPPPTDAHTQGRKFRRWGVRTQVPPCLSECAARPAQMCVFGGDVDMHVGAT